MKLSLNLCFGSRPTAAAAGRFLMRTSAFRLLGLAVLAGFVLLGSTAMAASRTWSGAGANANWSTTLNWNTVPVANDDLTFAGTTQLTNTNNITAGTAFTGITFAAGAGAFVLGGNQITLSGAVNNYSTSLQTINLDIILNSTQTFSSALGKGDMILGGSISGAGGLIKGGNTTLTLNGANTYTGNTQMTGGTLAVNNVNALANSTLRNDGGGNVTFVVAGNNTYNIGNIVGNQTLAFGGNTLSVGANNQSRSYSGLMSGTSGNLIKVGLGILNLSGANTFSGTTTVQAGYLEAGASSLASTNGAFGNAASAIVLGNGSTLAGDTPSLLINGAFTVGRNITVGSVSNSAAYNATIGGDSADTSTYTGSITLNTTAANYTATLQAATGGTVNFSTGTWTTNNKPIAIGSSTNTGTVQLSNAIATSGGINVNYGTLTLNSAFTSGNMTVASGTTLSGNGSVAGTTGVTSATVNGSGLTLTGVTTFNSTGNTLSGTVTSTNGVTLASGAALADNGTLTGNMTVGNGTLTGTGSVSGTTGVTGGTVNGSGLTLTGVTTFNSTGNTLSGTVTSTNGVTLASGAALANNGALTGTLAVGNGTLTGTSGSVSGATTLNGGMRWTPEFGPVGKL